MKKWLKLAFQWWKIAVQDPRRVFLFPRELYLYFSDLRRFRQAAGASAKIEISPVFFQRNIRSTFDAHYTYQSAWAIRRIASARPAEHVDISSNIPYVAALSAVVPVRFCEFRPPLLDLPGVTTEHADITKLPFPNRSIKSMSCLHVLEHIGLGRYGDPINPKGLELACAEIARVAAPGASIFLSLPIGKEKISFNMHRVSAPTMLPSLFSGRFRLREFSVVTDAGRFLEAVKAQDFVAEEYACGLYWFEAL